MRLREWRKNKGFSQEQVANPIGVTISQYSKIERGETFVSPTTAEKIRAFTRDEVSLNDLHDVWREHQGSEAGAAA